MKKDKNFDFIAKRKKMHTKCPESPKTAFWGLLDAKFGFEDNTFL
jgi:hypothetical protein